MIEWGMVVLMSVITIVLLSGHGSILIAGYNTASKREKEKYDKKRLCRITGIGMGIIDILLILLSLFPEKEGMAGLFGIGTVLVCVGIIICSNVLCKVKASDKINGSENEEKHPNRKAAYVGFVSASVILILVAVFLCTGKVTVDMKESMVLVKASYWKGRDIPYASIESISYQEKTAPANRVYGLSSPRLQAGDFKSKELGTHYRYSYTVCKAGVLLKTDRETILINSKDEKQTKQLYEQLRNKVHKEREDKK